MNHKISESNIELAKISDRDELIQILKLANAYAEGKSGEPMWTAMEYVQGQLSSHIESGECFVLRDEQKIAATITITENDALWGSDSDDGNALYIHKLMKNPEYNLLNIGLVFILFAAHEALRRNRSLLRCDTKPTQERLVNYYQKLGFITKGSFRYSVTDKAGVLLEAQAKEVIGQIAMQDNT